MENFMNNTEQQGGEGAAFFDPPPLLVGVLLPSRTEKAPGL